MFNFLAKHQIEAAIVPIDTTGAAANGDYVSMKNADRLVIVLLQGAWAGGTPAVTLTQASDASGTGAKALAFTEKVSKTGLGSAAWTEATVSSNTFNLPATANTITAIEIRAEDLDMDNGFCFVRASVASPGSNADLIAGIYILDGLRYQGTPSGLLAATA